MGALSPDGPVALDTAVFIYFVEENPEYLGLVDPIFEAAASGASQIVTSAITLLELLVIPFRSNDLKLVSRYEQLMTNSRGIRLVPIDNSQLRAAASLRGSLRLGVADALQIAAAIATGCDTFVTNDRRLPEIKGLRIVQLSDLN